MHASHHVAFEVLTFLLALCLFFHSNKSIWLDKNKQLFSLRIFCTIQIYLSLSEKINRENLNNLKIWRTWRHTCYFVANFCPNFCLIFFFYVVVIELSACFKSVIVYTYLKVKWGSTPCFLSKLTVIKIKNKVTLLVAFSTNSTAKAEQPIHYY